MSEITTEHHNYLVALTFDKTDETKRVVIKIEKTDEDEIYFAFTDKILSGFYFSLDQFIQLMKNIFREELKNAEIENRYNL